MGTKITSQDKHTQSSIDKMVKGIYREPNQEQLLKVSDNVNSLFIQNRSKQTNTQIPEQKTDAPENNAVLNL